MSDKFFDNLLRGQTWSTAADLNHIIHPLRKPTQAYQEPDLSDRISGSILFALSMLLVIPGCFYLYEVTKKVKYYDRIRSGSTEGKVQEVARGVVKTEKEKPVETKKESSFISSTLATTSKLIPPPLWQLNDRGEPISNNKPVKVEAILKSLVFFD